MTEPDHPQHRPNVGVVLFHRDGRVWLGRRHRQAPPYNWQFPQGGVDDGEDLEAAARRELQKCTFICQLDWQGRCGRVVGAFKQVPGWHHIGLFCLRVLNAINIAVSLLTYRTKKILVSGNNGFRSLDYK